MPITNTMIIVLITMSNLLRQYRSRCHGNVRLNDVSKRRRLPGFVSRHGLFRLAVF